MKKKSLTSLIFPSCGFSLNPEAADAAVCWFPSRDSSHNPGSDATKAADAAVSSVGTGASKISPSSFPRHCLHISAHKNTSNWVFKVGGQNLYTKSPIKPLQLNLIPPTKNLAVFSVDLNPLKDFVTKWVAYFEKAHSNILCIKISETYHLV